MGTNPKRVRVAVFGIFGAGNLGNECTLSAMLLNFKRYLPSAEISCICAGPDEAAATYNIPAFPIREGRLPQIKNPIARFLAKAFLGIPLELYRWIKVICRLKNFDMLVMTGTGMLSDLGIVPFGLHYDILRWSLAAILSRCRLLFVSVGVGPIGRPLSRFFVKSALGLADYRSYRDTFSKDYLESIGFQRPCDKVYPDLAFSLPRTKAPIGRVGTPHRNVIGVGLIVHSRRRATACEDQQIYQDYITKIATFVGGLLDRGYPVRLLIGDTRYDQRASQDLKTLVEQRGMRYKRGDIAEEPPQSVTELLSQLENTDIVVASRFHNVLLSLMLGKPVVAISFHEKVDALMDALGLSEFCQDIENIDLNRLEKQFAAIEENLTSLRLQILQRSEQYRAALDRQYEEIAKAHRGQASAAN